MINTAVRGGAVVALLVVFVACGSSGPTSPSGFSQPPPSPSPTPTPAPTPSPPISFPPLSGPSRTFIFASEVGYSVRDFTKQSRFVLYENGAFGLRYEANSFGPAYTYAGQYQNANGVLLFLFEFQGRTVDDIWDDATATLSGDTLTVQYDLTMQHSDFENAAYVLMQ